MGGVCIEGEEMKKWEMFWRVGFGFFGMMVFICFWNKVFFCLLL